MKGKGEHTFRTPVLVKTTPTPFAEVVVFPKVNYNDSLVP
jgi:hypothetical protein